MQGRAAIIVWKVHIRVVLQKQPNQFHVSILRRTIQQAVALIVLDFRRRVIFEEDSSNLRMALSTCFTQRGHVLITAQSVHVLGSLDDEKPDDVVQAKKCRIM
jgi:hypothetical protein